MGATTAIVLGAALARLDASRSRRTRTTARASSSPSSSAGGSGTCSSTRPARRRPDADLVWIEAPSNPLLTMPDFEAAAAHPGLVVCDATAATPVHLRPLEHGCDLVLHSATKYLAGHHDVLLGAVVAKRPEHADRLRELRTRTGIVAAPDAAWLLAARPEDARGPGRPPDRDGRRRSRPGSASTRRSQTVRYPGFGGLLSFDVADGERRAARRDRRRG